MIRAKIAQAKELIDKVSAGQILASYYKQYAAFLSELDNRLPQLKRYQQSSQVLQEQRPENFRGQDVTGIINKISLMLSSLQDGSDPPKKNMVIQLTSQVNELEEKLKKAWQAYASSISRNSLGLLESTKGVLNDPSKIDDVINKLALIQSQWPVANNTLQDLTNALEEALQIIQDLNAGEDVQKFLELVFSRKARVSDLKPEVLEWLENQGLTDNLEISFANSQRRM
ncbi:hypothetical protein DCCM_0019 [Desulfocucumis palustris]|uniref:Uncharacterized protein n=1 Tax=Desulfocucumis palustris TaxID=1898651 RepID=A0A2L2X6R2_9FIRM|nr:hypothetical protein [Desulfocucumis palustris]GBF31835.1 hypothetical protein DCCM_0019 [Desulfocucumis palustris]